MCVKGGSMNREQEAKQRIEEIRAEILAETVSYNEVTELESLAECIDEDDVLMLQWAGVPEFEEE